MNQDLINQLSQITHIYETIGDSGRQIAYRKLTSRIKQLTVQLVLSNYLEYINTPAARIDVQQYLSTGKISRLDILLSDERYLAYGIFGKIIGVGPSTIAEWAKKDIYTIAALRKAIYSRKVTLTHAQSVGLLYLDKITTKISRQTAEWVAQCIDKFNPVIVGSYRRGKTSLQDIDILIVAKSMKPIFEYISQLPNFVEVIHVGNEQCTYLFSKDTDIMQVDIRLCLTANYGAMLLYFTGSYEFNIRMRAIARDTGLKLNQNGLFRGEKRIAGKTEEEIFKKLQLAYLQPRMRE